MFLTFLNGGNREAKWLELENTLKLHKNYDSGIRN